MQSKLKMFFSVALIAICAISFTSCTEDEVLLANLNVTLTPATDFDGLAVDGVYVYATNTVDNSTDSVLTDATGVAAFIDMAPGTYNVSSSVALTAEEAGEASGYYEEMTLNAVVNSIELIGGATVDTIAELNGSPASSLVIKEVYYSGANDPLWAVMFKDQFVEIYNNSAEVVYADGLYLASIVPTRSGSDDNDAPNEMDLTEFIYADKVAQVPGSGTDYPINPGEGMVIAYNAADWTEGGTKSDITVDLSTADFELYAVSWLESLGRQGNAFFDIDNADVPNMNMIYLNIENFGSFNLYPSGASVAIFRSETTPTETIVDPISSESNPITYLKIPVADVIDGIECLFDAESAPYKRLPETIDAGFNYVEGSSYTSQSIRRKVAKETADGRKILLDTNNSTNDTEVTSPATPWSYNN